MPSVKLSPIGNDQIVTHAGAPAAGWYWSAFAAGSSTPQATYTSSAGTVAQAAQITLNADGVPDNPIWLVAGLAYKFVLYDSSDVSQRTIDNVVGINDTSVSIAQWLASGATPTYISATQFSLVGDQTSEFHIGRRVQCLVTAGTVYGTITASAYTSLTTVTVLLDSGTLDSGLSAANLSILRADHGAMPTRGYTSIDTSGAITAGDGVNLPAGKNIVFEGTTDDAFETTISGGEPTADRTFTLPNETGTGALIGHLRSFLAGLGMSTAGSSATMTVAAGTAADSTNVAMMTLASAMAKTTSAWAAGTGNGGLDTGTIANSTWYHFYQIAKADGTTDVLFSTSVSSPTMPSGYVYKRRIGSGRTNGSAQWVKFVQDGDTFQWDVPVADVNTSSTAANRTLYTLSVPTGLRVQANVSVAHFSSVTSTHATLLTDPSTADTAPSLSAFTIAGSNQTSGATHGGMASVYTDTSARIGARSMFINTLNINTHGWIDRRGRDA